MKENQELECINFFIGGAIKMKNKKIWLGVFILIIIEQGIKLFINNNYLDKTFPILPPLLYFQPMFNRQYSWFNSMLGLGVGKWVHIVVVAVMLCFLYVFYKYLSSHLKKRKYLNVMFAFIFSGAICSLIDKVFWNGSLDYILVDGYFTFDLKDVYIDIFIGLMILSLILKNGVLRQVEDKIAIKEFVKFIRNKK